MSNFLDRTTFIQAFRQSAPYINAHRKKTVVIFIDSEALTSEYLTRVVYDIALLNSLGVRIVLTMSTRDLIATKLKKQGITSQYHKDRRITTPEILDIAQQVSGKFRFDLEARFSNALPNTPMHGTNIRAVSGNFVTAKPLGVIDGIDFQFSATVRKIDTTAIESLLNNEAIVLLSNIAYTATGECFNVRAEEVALAAAKALHADKFIVYSNDKLIEQCPHEMLASEAKARVDLLNTNFHCLIEAAEAGIARCHMISLEQDGALLAELFTTDGSGILVSNDPFESIRQANSSDIIAIMHLLAPLETNGQLIPRDRETLEQDIQYFHVIERDKRIIACASLIPFGNMAEIASVACHEDYQGAKRASQIIKHLEKTAQSKEFPQVFVMTTQSEHFFMEMGYNAIAIDQLPEKKLANLDTKRGAKALIKNT